jgi:P27 family predicted phage terminase small subunit
MPNRRSPHPQGHRSTKGAADVTPLRGLPTLDQAECPPKLCAEALRVWEDFWASDISAAAKRSDHYALRRWIEAVDEREGLMRVVREAQLVDGSQGQPRLNPLFKRLGEVEKHIADFEERFGMTPRARAALGIEVGKAAMTADQLNRMARNGSDQDAPEGGQIEEGIDGFIDA